MEMVMTSAVVSSRLHLCAHLKRNPFETLRHPIYFPAFSHSHLFHKSTSKGFYPFQLIQRSKPSSCRWNHVSVFCLISTQTSPSSCSASLNSTRLYVSGLSFRTNQESLRRAFQSFGQLVEVNLVMDRVANRPRGFAFLRYSTEDEAKKAIDRMHGKFLDGRVIFVEFANSKIQGSTQQSRVKAIHRE